MSVSSDRRQGVNAGAAVKVACRAGTTSNIVLNGLQTIDGVTLAEGERVLVRQQTNSIDNGIYTASAGQWRRAPDFDGQFDVVKGTQVYVTDGFTQAGIRYALLSIDPVVIGTNFIDFGTPGSLTDLAADLLQGIAPALGDALIGVKRDDVTGAVTTTQHLYNAGLVLSLWNFLNAAQIADVQAGTALVDCTGAIQLALNAANPIDVPEGTYLTDGVTFPTSGKKVFLGRGSRTIFQARSTNITIFAKAATAGSIDNACVGNFAIKAHTAGSTAPAFKCTGFRNSVFYPIEGLSNNNNGFVSLFDVAANPYACSTNLWIKPTLNATTGWTRMFNFNNNGTASAANNSTVGKILDAWAVDNVGMTTIIDGVRSAKIEVSGGLFKNNGGATAIVPGQMWHVHDAWFELNGADFAFTSPEAGSQSASCLILSSYFATAHSIDMTSAIGIRWTDNKEAGVQTWTNNGAGLNYKMKTPEAAVLAPTIAYSSGQAGTLTISSNSLVAKQQADRIMFRSIYTWTANASTTQTSFVLASSTGSSAAPVAGYKLLSVLPTAYRGASGEPSIMANDANLGLMWLQNKTTDANTLIAMSEWQYDG